MRRFFYFGNKGALETRAPRSREAAERVVIGRGSHQSISHLQSREIARGVHVTRMIVAPKKKRVQM